MKQVHILVGLFFFIPLLTGCWNQQELTDLAFIMGLGVDKEKNGQYIVSIQNVIPGNVSSGQNGSSGQGVPVVTLKASGKSVTEAVRKLTKSLSRRPYFSHTNLIVIGEDLAKSGVLNIFDGIDRDVQFRTSSGIVIARGTTAANLLSDLSVVDKIPVAKIVKALESTESLLGENEKLTIDDFISALVSDGKDAIVSGFSITGKPQAGEKLELTQTTRPPSIVSADGLAMFRKGKLVGWLDGSKARGALLVRNKVINTNISVDWKGEKDAISYVTERAKAKVSAMIQKGKPVIQVMIENEGNVHELNAPIDIESPDVIAKIEKGISAAIESEVSSAIQTAQRQKADIFGFGEKVHRKDPKLWHQINKNWDEHFSTLKVQVKVKTYIRREGLRTNPFRINLHR